MTWLSRLHAQRARTRRRSERLRGHTAKQRRRRILGLEGLEARTVLSSVTTNPGFIFGALTITADRFNNRFSIAEFKENGVSRVTITALDSATLINGGTAWTSLGAVSSIVVNLKSGPVADKDYIQLFGGGRDVGQGTKYVTFNVARTNLELDIFNINNPGAFKLTTEGRLDLEMTDSQWSSVEISQTGCCPANVSFDNVNVSGDVTVKEGWGDDSSISVSNSSFGHTVLSQYNGTQQQQANCEGDNNSISVTNSQLLTLDIDQCGGDGDGNTVVVDGLLVAQSVDTYFGVSICQGDGDRNSVVVNDVIVFGRPNLRIPPTAGIEVVQGCGDDVSAEITDSTVPGDVTIVQGCGEPCDGVLTPSGVSPYARIENVSAGLPDSLSAGEIRIDQGDGKDSDAYIFSSSTAELDISIEQGDGELDTAWILDVASGDGISITQGEAYYTGDPKKDPHGGDLAWIGFSSADSDVIIKQCDVANPVLPEDVPLPLGSNALIDTVDTGGSICIFQGEKDFDWAMISSSTTTRGWIKIAQGDGDGNTAEINDSSTLPDPEDKFINDGIEIRQGQGDDNRASISGSYSDFVIWVMQGDGDRAAAEVTESTARFQVCIWQGDGEDDSALISHSEVLDADPDYDTVSFCIDQGEGDRDEATIECSVGAGDGYVVQGGGDHDVIKILGLVLGSVDHSGGFPRDIYGTLTLTQGDGYADLVVIDDCDGLITEVNNVCIDQGDSLPYEGCEEGLSDTILINDTFITSDLCIDQGYTDGEETGFGYYVVEIGTDSIVEAYGYTMINQAGEANTILMGEDPFNGTTGEFIATWLDAWQGSGGGAFAWVANTTVQYGSADYPTNFNAGPADDGDPDTPYDPGNTFVDAGGNTNVTFSGAYNILE